METKVRRRFGLVIGLLILFVFSCADSMMFQPPKASYRDTEAVLKVPVTGREQISAVYLSCSDSKYVVLFSHGNAEDLGGCGSFLQLYARHGFSVFGYDYRGYGTSGGRASEGNTYRDIEAAYDYLVDELKVPPKCILVHGRSIGSGPAVYLASRRTVGGLIIESGFSYASRVALPFALPFGPYPNVDRLVDVNVPVLVIHGMRDRVISFAHGQELYARVKGPKRCLWVEDAGHNNLLRTAGEAYWEHLKQFAAMVEAHQSRAALGSASQ